MPYCPKCDMEFIKGVTVCSDCGGPLFESKEEALAMQKAALAKEPDALMQETWTARNPERNPGRCQRRKSRCARPLPT